MRLTVLAASLLLLAEFRAFAGEPLVPDQNLDAAIKAAMPQHKGELTEPSLANLYFLDANKKGIQSLAGLEKCTNLMEVRLADNKIADLKPFAELKNVQSLTLSKNQIADIKPLGQLVKLQYLELSDNRIRDLAPLAGLNALSSLYMNGNEVGDLGPIANLTKLASLSAGRNKLKDITPIAKCTRLTTLDLGDNQIEDVSALGAMNDLGIVILTKNRIGDLAPLVKTCQADAAGPKRFAPYLRLYLAGNPVNTDAARKNQIDALRAAGVRIDGASKP